MMHGQKNIKLWPLFLEMNVWAADEGTREQTGELNGKKIKQEQKRRH